MMTPGSGFRFLRILLLTGVIFIGVITTAWSQSFNFRHITKEHGISGVEIYKAIQDRNGYIWCATDAGVFKYNGTEFRIFTQEDGLPGLTFYAMFEDQYGLIWVSCSDGQVGYFKESKYYSIPANSTITKLLMNGQRLIYEIYVDSGDTLWLGTQHRLLKVSPERNYATVFEVNSNRTNSVRLVREVDKGVVVTSLDYKTDKSKTRKINNGTEFASDIVLQMRNGTFTFEHTWDAQLGSTSLLSAISLDDSCMLIGFGNKIIRWKRDNSQEVIKFGSRVLKLVTDKEKNLWVCLDKNGVMLFQNGDLNNTPVHLLKNVSVANILVDKEKNLWVSTLGNGLLFSPTLQIQYFGNIVGLDKGIVALGTIKDKVLAITAGDQGFAFDSVGNTSMVFDFTSSFTLGSYKIRNYDSIAFVVGSRTGFLTKDLRLPFPMMEDGNYLYSQDYYPIAKDTDLILVHSEIRIFSKGELLRKYPLPGRGLNLLVLNRGKYLIGTLNGLYLFENEKFTLLSNEHPDLAFRINAITTDSKGRIWVCTKGRGVLFKDQGKWYSLRQKNGMISDLCNTIVETFPGVYFVGTANGLTRIIEEAGNTFSYSNFDVNNGLSGNAIQSLTFMSPWLWIGTSNGLNRLSVKEITRNTVPPKVYLNRLFVNDKTEMQYAENIVFRYDQNNLKVVTDVLTFKRQKGVRLNYILSGADLNLDRTIEGNNFEIQNIPSGKYRLTVWGINNDGVRSKVPLILSFVVKRPFWKEWWFIIPLIVIVVASTFIFLRWRLKLQLEKRAEKVGVERKLAEYRLEALRAQMNPHFVFNAINGIQSKILQKDPHEAYTYLAKFSQLIRLFLTGTMQQYVPLQKEVESLKLYVEFEQLRFDDSFDFDIFVSPELEDEGIHIPSMIIQPFVENAIWHGLMPLNKRKGKVSIRIEKSGEHLLITISDNGVGILKSREKPRPTAHTSFGIELTRKRVDLLTNQNGKITVGNNPDGSEGTTVQIWI